MDDLRDQFSAETESDAVGRIRFYAANLCIFFGALGLFGFLPMVLGEMSWAAAPGCLLMAAGGVLGVGVHRSVDVVHARRLGVWAAMATLVGFAEFFLVNSLQP